MLRASINSKLQTYPPLRAIPRAFDLLKIVLFEFPPPRAKIVFKCPAQFFFLQNAESACCVACYILTKLQNVDLVDFFSEPFACESGLFTWSTSIFKNINFYSAERLVTTGSNFLTPVQIPLHQPGKVKIPYHWARTMVNVSGLPGGCRSFKLIGAPIISTLEKALLGKEN